MKHSIKHIAAAVLALAIGAGCQKMNKPAMGNYPADVNPVGGPLKFYAAFDGSSDDKLRNAVDSIRANFPSKNTGDYTDGISGKAYQGNPDSYIQYLAANDFTSVSSFTVAFWIKKTPQAAGQGTNFAFSLNANDYSWTKLKMFLLFEDAGQSTTSAAAAKFYLNDQWFEYTGAKAMANVLNGEWHQLIFSYDAGTSTLSTYIDGVAPTNLPAGFGTFNAGGAPDFSGTTGFTIGGAGESAKNANGWMGNFDGAIDQFRLYGTALSASEAQALYNSRL